jgi:hypothetical protein
MQLRQWRIRRIHFYVLGACHLDDINPFKLLLKTGLRTILQRMSHFQFFGSQILGVVGVRFNV